LQLLTGGAGGSGLATAKTFLKEGAKGIALVDFNQKTSMRLKGT